MMCTPALALLLVLLLGGCCCCSSASALGASPAAAASLDFGSAPGVVYETVAYYEPGPIGLLFNMMRAFLHVVQPNPFPQGKLLKPAPCFSSLCPGELTCPPAHLPVPHLGWSQDPFIFVKPTKKSVL